MALQETEEFNTVVQLISMNIAILMITAHNLIMLKNDNIKMKSYPLVENGQAIMEWACEVLHT